MKQNRFISITSLFIMISCVFAQKPFNRGDYSIGGSAYYKQSTTKMKGIIEGSEIIYKVNAKAYNINPSFAYFIFPKISIGLILNKNSNVEKYKETSSVEQTAFTYKYSCTGIGVSIRCYENFSFLHPFIGFGYYISQGKNIYYEEEKDYRGTQLDVFCGMSYFISKTIAIEPMITYRPVERKTNYVLKECGNLYNVEEDFGSTNLIFSVGIRAYIF